MKHRLLLLLLFICFIFKISGHGLGARTSVQQENIYTSIESLFQNPRQKKLWVSCYDFNSNTVITARVKAVGESISNCYIQISFDDNPNNDILCTPSQEFYVAHLQQWLPVFQQHVGDELLSINGTHPIKSIKFIKKSLKVYALEIEKAHNFFVGSYGILTHNMPLPLAFTAGLAISFGTGAAAGGAAGGCFGPITLIGGVALGGIVGIAIKMVSDNKKLNYRLHFDVGTIDAHFEDRSEHKEQSDDGKEKPTQKEGGLTNEEARKKAKKWGYKETKDGKFNSFGRPKFIKGNSIITPDRNGHNGGIWKEFDRKNRRIGTLDENGKKIKD